MSNEARFDSHVDFDGPGGCWLWSGFIKPNGYANFAVGGKGQQKGSGAHRWNYERHVGPIPEGWQVDHLCKVPHCVNPAHLEAVPPHVNNARSESPSARNMRKTHCPQGHPLEGDNLHPSYLRRGQRKCRTCHREAAARNNAKRKRSA
jgi:hypothetical protein